MLADSQLTGGRGCTRVPGLSFLLDPPACDLRAMVTDPAMKGIVPHVFVCKLVAIVQEEGVPRLRVREEAHCTVGHKAHPA